VVKADESDHLVIFFSYNGPIHPGVLEWISFYHLQTASNLPVTMKRAILRNFVVN
jgi:hypothetical protein